METDSPNKENILGENYFQILYPNQNYKSSLEYKQWKENVEEILGKKGKEVFCEKDNIIIYQKYHKIDIGIYCPICNKFLYGCEYCNKISNQVTKSCCIQAFINENIKNSYKFIKMENKEDKDDFYYNLFINFIPFSFLYRTILIPIIIFLSIENKRNIMIDQVLENMKENLNNIFEIAFMLYILLMLKTYTILFYSIYLIILILSLPFKLYPIKLLLGFYSSILD